MEKKKLHRFYIPEIPKTETFELADKKLVHQLTTVLRYHSGDTFCIFSKGSDDVVVSLDAISPTVLTLSKQYSIPAQHLPHRTVIAAISIPKKDLFELIVQKLTELGVSIIVPIRSDRTVKQSLRLDRLRMISTEATEQSGRNTLVTIGEPITIDQCFTLYPFQSVVFDTDTVATPLSLSVDSPVVMYVGPEGGWSATDHQLFEAQSTVVQSLGYTVLRTETAAIVGAYELLRHI